MSKGVASGEPVGDCGCRLERAEHGLRTVDCQLHAAAPDLLAALEGLVDAHDEQPAMLTATHWEAARAALAKVRGGRA